MSALEDLRNKKTPPTELELCILMAGTLENPEVAAKELADFRLRLDLLAKAATFQEAKKNELQEENKILVQWLEHVAGVGSPIEIKLTTGGIHTIEATPHYFSDCETCKQIAEYLARYHGQ